MSDTHPVPAQVVESTWRHVAALEPGAARRLMEQAAERQPALLAYVMASTARSRAPVQELAVYLSYVVLQMFERDAPEPLTTVSVARVEYHADRNDGLLDKLAPADERFLQRAAEVESSAQPFVLRYIAEALLEDAELDESVAFAPDETGLVYLALKTVVDALHEARVGLEG